MKIREIEVYSVDLHYREPFRIATSARNRGFAKQIVRGVVHRLLPNYGAGTKSPNIIVKIITDNDLVGWGASSPSKMVTGETRNTIIRVLTRIAPKLIGTCPSKIEQIIELMDSIIKGEPAAKASIDIALHDILGKNHSRPLYMLLGGCRTEILTDRTLSIKSPKEMAEDAIRFVNDGSKILKIKVGTNVVEDVERVRLIRQTVGDEIQLRIDANQGWMPKEAIEALNRMAEFNVQFAEQPVSAEDIGGLIEVRKKSPIPIMADESVHSPEDAQQLIESDAVDFINIKLMKSGGILKGKKIAEIAEAARIPCMVGCMGGESEISIAAGTHLAAGVRNIIFADLASGFLLKDKLVKKSGMSVRNSIRTVSENYGLGIEEVDSEMLGKPIRIWKRNP